MERVILHVDLDAFFVSVEELLRPELRGQPVVVGGDPSGRGVVSSASYAARKFGVRSAMPVSQALRLCPQAICLPTRHDLYQHHSKLVMLALQRWSHLIEQISIDEAYLDISGVPWDRAVADAHTLQSTILNDHGLSASIGLATSKLVAKIASDEQKPRGLTVVAPGNEAAFLAPMPVERLWGVGPKTAERLHQLGLRSIGDVARAPEETLRREFGSMGADLRERAVGIDASPIVTERPMRSMSAEHTFGHDTTDKDEIEKRVRLLSDTVAAGLRRHHLLARTVVMKLRYRTFETVTRSATMLIPTNREQAIAAIALRLLQETWSGLTPIRLIGVGVHHPDASGIVQPTLFDAIELDDARVATAFDSIRDRFGPQAIWRGRRPSS
jgi:DNA polymerase-4